MKLPLYFGFFATFLATSAYGSELEALDGEPETHEEAEVTTVTTTVAPPAQAPVLPSEVPGGVTSRFNILKLQQAEILNWLVATLRLFHTGLTDFETHLKQLVEGQIANEQRSILLYAQMREIQQEIIKGLPQDQEAEQRQAMKEKLNEYKDLVKLRYDTIHKIMELLRRTNTPGFPPVSMGSNPFGVLGQGLVEERILKEYSGYT